MPANEQTWRSLPLMHVVFGATGLLMLGASIWMLAADHNRQWKDYQRQFQQVEIWTAESRVAEQQSTSFTKREAELQAKVNETLRVKPSAEVAAEVAAFVKDAMPFAGSDRNNYDLKAMNDALAAWQGASTDQLESRRQKLLDAIQAVVTKARFEEGKRQSALKFRRADLDVDRSQYSIGIDEGKDEATLDKIQAKIKIVEDDVRALNEAYQAAKTHRLALEAHQAKITADETAARKALADFRGPLEQRKAALVERQPESWWGRLGRKVLEQPIIDAFGRPLKIEQIWLPNLTINNNFIDVARFDRCTTCHQGIDRTAPGSAIDPGYEPTYRLVVTLPTPKAPPKSVKVDGEETEATLSKQYGIELAASGKFNPNDATIEVVWPLTVAASAGLKAGDVIEQIDNAQIGDRATAEQFLLRTVTWGKPLQLTVRRGVPHPFSSHPRLDLFVGSLSPHKSAEMGCTICHEGQGSATEFKWASHTPNTPKQAEEWSTKYGWFNNHHWIFPQTPERFNESTCLKCHHDVTELEPSERFPDPPAPKVVEGYHLIRQYGCFGCHEINGFDGPSRRKGPDLRAEPPYFAAAQTVLTDPAIDGAMRSLAAAVVAHPEQTESRKLLAEQINAAAPHGKPTKLAPSTVKMAGILGADDDTPGQFRKVGPSLRHVASKVDRDFLYHWVRDPSDFRPSTKMPKFFGLYDHLTPIPKVGADGKPLLDAQAKPELTPSPGLLASEKFEPIEMAAITEYLLSASEKFDYVAAPKGLSEAPSVERGKLMFQTRGCLACHKHADFPDAKNTQGPELSKLGSKLRGDRGRQWLYSWVREPNRYHARTVMPNLFLETIKQPDGKVFDPAADITAYLLSSQGWQPKSPAALPTIDAKNEALTELTRQYLAGSFTLDDAQQFADSGIPTERAAAAKGDEAVLVGDKLSPDELRRRKLLYVGRREISRLGCSGCHDIPGFEDAKPIGTALADWGRKDSSKLAFEQIIAYLTERQGEAAHGHGGDQEIAVRSAVGKHAEDHAAHGHLTVRDVDPDAGFYLEALLHHGREGFIWQKIREPRSYDYRKTEGKDYLDRLRMPKFNFTASQREAIITFVLGLVSEPPAARYIYKPSPRRQWIVKGEQVLEKYNCGGCHTLAMDEWTFDYKPSASNAADAFAAPPAWNDYAFLKPHFTPQELTASMRTDRRGLGRATVVGMPKPEIGEDDDGKPLYFFELWKPVAIDGHGWAVGSQDVPIQEAMLLKDLKRPPVGGDFARLLHPVVVALEQKVNANVKASDAWGWVPPPLLNEGRKVQTNWLHNFLLDPYPIRPAVVLRMPKFNMSSAEATALVNYFAAKDNVDYPYEFDPRVRQEYLSTAESQHPNRLRDALRLVTDNNYCVKCHLVGDFTPQGSEKAMAPQLDRVSQRIRPDFLQRWIANPKRQLPYTGMPVNFPIDKPADQKLFQGTSEQQVQAIVDLLLNWPTFMKDQTSIKPMVKPAPVPPPAGAAPPAS